MKIRGTNILSALAAAAALLAGAAAWAYMLPGPFIAGKVAEQRVAAGFDDLTVEGRAAVAGPSGEFEGAARLRVRSGGFLELSVAGASGEESLAMANGKVAGRPTDGMSVLASAMNGAGRELLWALPVREQPDSLSSSIRGAGVDTAKRALGRFHGRVVFTVGSESKDRVAPQVWVDKDTFQVMRVMVPDGKGGMLDIKLYDFQSPPLQGRFPAAIELWEGAARLFRFQAEKAAPRLQGDGERAKNPGGKAR